MTYHSRIAIDNLTATRLTPEGSHGGMDITTQNVNDSGYIYIGGEGVTSSDYGYRLDPKTAISFELTGHDALYAIASTTGLHLAVIQVSLESQN